MITLPDNRIKAKPLRNRKNVIVTNRVFAVFASNSHWGGQQISLSMGKIAIVPETTEKTIQSRKKTCCIYFDPGESHQQRRMLHRTPRRRIRNKVSALTALVERWRFGVKAFDIADRFKSTAMSILFVLNVHAERARFSTGNRPDGRCHGRVNNWNILNTVVPYQKRNYWDLVFFLSKHWNYGMMTITTTRTHFVSQ